MDYTDEICPCFEKVDGRWVCIWSMENEPPFIKTLSKLRDEALKICAVCRNTRKAETQLRITRVKEEIDFINSLRNRQ